MFTKSNKQRSLLQIWTIRYLLTLFVGLIVIGIISTSWMTHELKTPVASIDGLVQAVKDEVVTGEEAKEFLEICTKETNRLQKMVGDLLDKML